MAEVRKIQQGNAAATLKASNSDNMTLEQMQAELARLRQENERLSTASARKVSWKVSEKGAISIYGLGRFPVTLYASQFDKLDKCWPELLKFRQDNDSKLAKKE